MDFSGRVWRFLDDSNWESVKNALNGAGVESMQAKWEERFGVKEEVVVEEVKVKKPRKKATGKEPALPRPRKTTPKVPGEKSKDTKTSSTSDTVSKKAGKKSAKIK